MGSVSRWSAARFQVAGSNVKDESLFSFDEYA